MNTEIMRSGQAVLSLIRQFPKPRQHEAKLFQHLMGAYLKNPDAWVPRHDLRDCLGSRGTIGSKETRVTIRLGKLRELLASLPSDCACGYHWSLRWQGDRNTRSFRLETLHGNPRSDHAAPSYPIASVEHPRYAFFQKKGRKMLGNPPFFDTRHWHLMAFAKERLALELMIPQPSDTPWTFPGTRRAKDAFERLSKEHLGQVQAKRVAKSEAEAQSRIWDGRLWGVEEAVAHAQEDLILLRFKLARMWYRQTLYLIDHWDKPPAGCLVSGKMPAGGFHELLRVGSPTSAKSVPAISPLRLGVIVVLKKSKQFVLTVTGGDTAYSLAGRGMMFSLFTPEAKAAAKPDQQVNRRLVEDLGLAINLSDIKYLGYARSATDASEPSPKPPAHYLFASVEVNESEDSFLELFKNRRYDQFVSKPHFLPLEQAADAFRAHPKNYDSIARLGISIYLLSSGRAEIRPVPA